MPAGRPKRRSRPRRPSQKDIEAAIGLAGSRQGIIDPETLNRERGVVAGTAGALNRYAKRPPETIGKETAAFERAVAEQVADSLGD